MDTMPQELIDVVVDLVAEGQDHETLKACCLTASALRVPSQRALFRRLNVEGPDGPGATVGLPKVHRGVSSYQVARKLDESPHIAPYVAELLLAVRTNLYTEEDLEILGRILGRLTRVTTLNLVGQTPPMAVFEAILRFCAACPDGSLQTLTLGPMKDIPAKFLFQALSCTGQLSVSSCTLAAAETSNAPLGDTRLSTIKRLVVRRSPSVHLFLMTPDVLPQLSALEMLSTSLRWDPHQALYSASAQTIQRLVFHTFGSFVGNNGPEIHIEPAAFDANITFPSDLPALRSITFIVSSNQLRSGWFRRTLSALLGTSRTPQLRWIELHVSYPQLGRTTTAATNSPMVNEELLGHLDALWAGHPARLQQTVVWILVEKLLDDEGFNRFEESVRMGMPRAEEAGCLRFH
ncbi:hypothetical protein C8F01DRAFT_1171317 [Mycena amicta]|nr:hypothetical protein C8F01DRAFT_1171317 [Mycena amicta]